jgi:hypothetical protein
LKAALIAFSHWIPAPETLSDQSDATPENLRSVAIQPHVVVSSSGSPRRGVGDSAAGCAQNDSVCCVPATRHPHWHSQSAGRFPDGETHLGGAHLASSSSPGWNVPRPSASPSKGTGSGSARATATQTASGDVSATADFVAATQSATTPTTTRMMTKTAKTTTTTRPHHTQQGRP